MAVWLRCGVSIGILTAVGACDGSRGGTPTTQSPVQTIAWTNIDGFREWGQTSDGFFGTSGDYRLVTWKWVGATMTQDIDAKLPRTQDVIPLPDGVYLANVCPSPEGRGEWPLTLATTATNKITKEWRDPKGWSCFKTGVSANGRFAALVLMNEDDNDLKTQAYRIGLIDLSSQELHWMVDFRGVRMPIVRQIRASNDGRYVAISNWQNKALLADTAQHKVLWIDEPFEAVSLGYVAFSADGETLYEADSGGEAVYAVETKSGKILRKYVASENGKRTRTRRISCLALSPDDAWMAVGTGLDGQAFLFDTRLPEPKPIILPHGMTTILMASFSPDSTRVATVAGGKIKIWAVPGGGSGRPASQPASSRPASASGVEKGSRV